MALQIKSGEKILFVGDSITECGRFSQKDPLGVGYVRYFADFCLLREPEKKLTIINKGIGGNSIDDLRSRWTDDVIKHTPDWLCIEVGINDVNKFLCQPSYSFLSPDGFEEIYKYILDKTKRELPQTTIVLIDPFYLSTDMDPESYRGKVNTLLGKYLQIVDNLANSFNTLHLQTNTLFKNQCAKISPELLSEDMVHINSAGNLLLAEAVWSILQ